MPSEFSDQQNGVETSSRGSFFSFSGLVGGLIFGGLAIIVYYVKLPTTGMNETSILDLMLVWCFCGIIGGFLGEKLVNKIGVWISQLT